MALPVEPNDERTRATLQRFNSDNLIPSEHSLSSSPTHLVLINRFQEISTTQLRCDSPNPLRLPPPTKTIGYRVPQPSSSSPSIPATLYPPQRSGGFSPKPTAKSKKSFKSRATFPFLTRSILINTMSQAQGNECV